MKILLIILFYGFFYPYFENWFNWVQMDLPDKNKSWSEKLQFRPSNPASQWHFLSGGLVGILLNLLFLIPFNMINFFQILIACIIGGAIITGIEFALGYLLFYVLKIKRFWDYSNSQIKIFGKVIKLNIMGLIDIWHCLAWCGLTYLFYLVNHIFK
jgi:hypothetical protein